MTRPELQTGLATVPFLDPTAEIALAIGDAVQAVAEVARTNKHRIAKMGLAIGLTLGLGAETAGALPTHMSNSPAEVSPQTLEKVGTGTKIAVGAGAVGVVGAGLYEVGTHLFGWKWPWQDIHVNFSGGKPAEVVSGIDQQSYVVKRSMILTCDGEVSVAVGVNGKKDNGFWVGDGLFDKRIYGSFLLCGQEGTKLSTTLTIEKDKTTGNIISVSGFYPLLEPTHPKVDHLDDKNCIDANSKTTTEEADKKIAQRKADIANGKHPDCNDGFDTSFLPAPDKSTQVITLAYSAAELAIALDADPKKIIASKEAEYYKLIDYRIMGEYGISAEQLHMQKPVKTDDEILQDRILSVRDELKDRFASTTLEQKDGKTQLVAIGPGGEKVTVNFTGDLKISDITAANVTLQGK